MLVRETYEIVKTYEQHKKIEPNVVFSREDSLKETSYTLSKVLDLGEFTGTFGGLVRLRLCPTKNPYCSIVSYNGQRFPVNVHNISTLNHRIDLSNNGKIEFKILEHIMSVKAALNANFDIDILEGTSFPTLSNSISTFVSRIQENLSEQEEKTKYFTVAEPVKIDFLGKLGAYILLFPDEGEKKLTLDLAIKYPGKSIGEQRIIFDVNEEDYINHISKSRTNAFGLREKLLKLLNSKYFPTDFIRRNLLDLGYDNVFAFTKDKLINPKEEFFKKGVYLEVLYHNVLDLLGALGIDISLNGEKGYRFVGKIVAFANSHQNDIDMLKMLQKGDIAVARLE